MVDMTLQASLPAGGMMCLSCMLCTSTCSSTDVLPSRELTWRLATTRLYVQMNDRIYGH
jgi:hypothetical protein